MSAPNAAALQHFIDDRKQHVLKRFQTDEGEMEVMRQRRDVPAAVAPLEWVPSFSCPTHGELTIDQEHLAKFVADTQRPNRTYRA